MMKKNLFFGIIAVFVLIGSACSSDKDDKSVAEQIAGTYAGTIAVTQEDGTPLGNPMENQKIYITSIGEHAVDLELKDFQFSGIAVGDLKVSNVQVTDEGMVSGSASQVPIMGGMIKADLTLSGTVKNDAADLLIVVNAPLAPGGAVIKMNVTFKGSK